MDQSAAANNHKVPLTQIREILPHNNAERLEIAVVYGFQVVVQKGKYKVGNPILYVPIDSILPCKLQDVLFPPDSKIKLHKSRVRRIRIRGLASQGMLVGGDELFQAYGWVPGTLEEDYAEKLGITKYEPPEVNKGPAGTPGGRKVKRYENPFFHKYNGLDNIKWYPDKFKPEEIVVLQEKIHGTNSRASLLPFATNTLWRKLLKLLRLAPVNEFCYGSNNVQLQNKSGYVGFYGSDVYGMMFNKLDVQSKLKVGETIFGEIYGSGIQGKYTYGCIPGEHKFALFDVKVLLENGDQKWLSPDEVKAFAAERGFDMVPEIYRGPFVSLDFVKQYTIGSSVLAPSQKVREGVVVKALVNYDEFGNKRALKVISEKYLDDPTNTDNH